MRRPVPSWPIKQRNRTLEMGPLYPSLGIWSDQLVLLNWSDQMRVKSFHAGKSLKRQPGRRWGSEALTGRWRATRDRSPAGSQEARFVFLARTRPPYRDAAWVSELELSRRCPSLLWSLPEAAMTSAITRLYS